MVNICVCIVDRFCATEHFDRVAFSYVHSLFFVAVVVVISYMKKILHRFFRFLFGVSFFPVALKKSEINAFYVELQTNWTSRPFTLWFDILAIRCFASVCIPLFFELNSQLPLVLRQSYTAIVVTCGCNCGGWTIV